MNSNNSNYEVFRDCLSSVIVEKSNERPQQPPKRKSYKARRNQKPASDNVTSSSLPSARANPEDLADFVDFLASEIFSSLPTTLQTLTYTTAQQTPTLLTTTYPTPLPSSLVETLAAALPPSVPDTLTTYALLPSATDIPDLLLSPLLTDYIGAVTAPPPVWSTTRTEACEICERDWIPLSYHHLIPKAVHERVRKRGWHEEWQLNSVAWLCRACHSFVHRMASNEELATDWFTVERMMEREDLRVWAGWVGRIRWTKT